MDLDSLMRGFGPLQETLKKASSDRESASFTGSAGGGAVTLTLGGNLTVTALRVSPAALGACAGDATMLEDLIAAAINDALRQYKTRFGATPEEQIQKLMAGSDMGGLLSAFMRGPAS